MMKIILYMKMRKKKKIFEIKINDNKIPFSYYYKFKEKWQYIIQYSFKNTLSKRNHMFYSCESLIDLNLSNFNTQKVINMSYMFNECNSLTNINLSNFNIQNVTNIKEINLL